MPKNKTKKNCHVKNVFSCCCSIYEKKKLSFFPILNTIESFKFSLESERQNAHTMINDIASGEMVAQKKKRLGDDWVVVVCLCYFSVCEETIFFCMRWWNESWSFLYIFFLLLLPLLLITKYITISEIVLSSILNIFHLIRLENFFFFCVTHFLARPHFLYYYRRKSFFFFCFGLAFFFCFMLSLCMGMGVER